jgi:hypothetical protein
VRVYFRSLDADDPAKNASLIDDESKPTDNCVQSSDSPQCPSAPNGYPFDPVTDPNATTLGPATINVKATGKEVSIGLVVSRQQGDNYRVGASMHSEWVGGLEAIQNTGEGELRHTSGESLLDQSGQFNHPQVSELLTVWRTLHLEVDRFVSQTPTSDQAVLDQRGDFTDLKKKSLKDSTAPFMQAGIHGLKGGWIGGFLSLEFHTSVDTGWDNVDLSQPMADRYEVEGNDQDKVDVIVPKKQPDLLRGLKPQEISALTRRRYLVRDDEIAALTSAMADTSLTEALLAKAYILLVPVVKDPALSDIPFLISPGNAADRRNLTSTLFGLPPSQPPLRSSAGYWSTGLVSGFEGDRFADGDPRPNTNWTNKGDGAASADGYELAVTSASRIGTTSGPTKLRSVIHLETIRDLKENPPEKIPPRAATALVPLKLSPDVNKRVTAHEILHTLRLIHDDAIMCGGINVQDTDEGGTVTDAQLKTMRFRVSEPSTDPDPNSTCPPKP